MKTYKDPVKVSKFAGVNVISDKESRCTIGYVIEGKMIRMAVSYCSATDKFKRKIGRDLIVSRLACNFDCITLPLGKLPEDDINFALQMMFFGM
jgi:hypothetical protein